nr:MAG TPA: hypothetical protein [Caudoviricetes sp.]
MNIDITKIVQDKIDSLEREGVIEKTITETFEKTIISAITDSLSMYSLRREITVKMTEQVSKIVGEIDFQSYNGFMVEKMSQIINETCRKDICEKSEKEFKKLFLCQTKEIKLSSIFKRYREIVHLEVEENYCLHCKCKHDDYGFLDCELDYDTGTHNYKKYSKIAFTVQKNYKDISKGKICFLYLDGNNIKKKFKLVGLNDVELMLVQAYMNEIPIVIDVEDIDNCFDVDR